MITIKIIDKINGSLGRIHQNIAWRIIKYDIIIIAKT
jgi:hypothetical protein